MDKILFLEERYGRQSLHLEDDDLVDRLNNRYTVLALMTCILIITTEIYGGKPINCWTPGQFDAPHIAYTNSICWLKGSYYLPTEEITIPDRSQPRLYYVSYYQWTPFILLGMAALFLCPRFVWHAVSRQSGLNIRRLVESLKKYSEKDKSINYVGGALKEKFDSQKRFGGAICCGRRVSGFYSNVTIMYFMIKILYVINTFAQFFLLNSFLSFHFTSYGVEALKKLFSNEDWFESPRFPRVTMCDFMIRHLGSNQHWYAIQCNLPVNMYNEKIFLGIWLWLIILTILNVLSILTWIISLTPQHRLAAVEKYLRLLRRIPSTKSRTSEKTYLGSARPSGREELFGLFTRYLHLDGFLIFRIIAHNTDETTAGRILEYLYDNFEPEIIEPVIL